MIRLFKYKVVNYDPMNEEDKGKLITNYGIVVANTCSAAVAKVEDLYGEDNVYTCTVDVIEDDCIKETTEKIFNELKYLN
jgi:hypothetical protein